MSRVEPGSVLPLVAGVSRLLLRVPVAWAWAPVALWCGLIWKLGSTPPPRVGVRGVLGSFLANLAHAPEYGVLALLLALATPRREGWPDLRPRIVLLLLCGVATFGLVDEVHQSFTPGRRASPFDVLTDVAGAAATLACIREAGGPAASGRGFARAFALGLIACAAAAGLATWADRS